MKIFIFFPALLLLIYSQNTFAVTSCETVTSEEFRRLGVIGSHLKIPSTLNFEKKVAENQLQKSEVNRGEGSYTASILERNYKIGKTYTHVTRIWDNKTSKYNPTFKAYYDGQGNLVAFLSNRNQDRDIFGGKESSKLVTFDGKCDVEHVLWIDNEDYGKNPEGLERGKSVDFTLNREVCENLNAHIKSKRPPIEFRTVPYRYWCADNGANLVGQVCKCPGGEILDGESGPKSCPNFDPSNKSSGFTFVYNKCQEFADKWGSPEKIETLSPGYIEHGDTI